MLNKKIESILERIDQKLDRIDYRMTALEDRLDYLEKSRLRKSRIAVEHETTPISKGHIKSYTERISKLRRRRKRL